MRYQFIEALVGLHESVEIVYVVWGYHAELLVDDDAQCLLATSAETIEEALQKLDDLCLAHITKDLDK